MADHTRTSADDGKPSLVYAKARVPARRRGFVHRTDLIERLMGERDRAVTLIVAPAGYGKSTLLTQWTQADPIRRFAWVALEPTDNDPVTMWRYILVALRTLKPGLSDRAWALLHRPEPDLSRVVSEVVNALADMTGRLVLVLDDFHAITNPKCHASIQYFIDHLPHSVQIAIATRTRPPLTLSKLEASRMALEVDRSDLQFTADETRRAIDLANSDLPLDVHARIHAGTDGWPAGVYLSAVGADTTHTDQGSGSGTKRTLDRYVYEQVITRLSPEDRSILSQWSILTRLNADLCDRVTGRGDGAETLARMAEENQLVIPLDSQRYWYRLHDLLRSSLSREFALLHEGERRSAHLNAMAWWQEQGEIAEAIEHAIEAGDHIHAAELICGHWWDHQTTGRTETVRQWFDRLPEPAKDAYPPLLIAAAWNSALSGQVDGAYRYAARAGSRAYDGPMPDGSASYASALAILRASLGHDGMIDANHHAEMAYRLEPIGSPWRSVAAGLVGVTRFGLGRFDEAREALGEAAGYRAGLDITAIYARGQLALLEVLNDNWDAARRHAEAACASVDELGVADLLPAAAAQVAAAAVAAHTGQHGLALQKLRSLSQVQGKLSDAIPFDALEIHLVAAETYLVLGDRRAAAVHATTASSRLDTFGDAGIFEPRLDAVLQAMDHSVPQSDATNGDGTRLTDRELQILRLLPTDLSLRDIGSEIFVSRNTAKTHLSNVYRKLGVTSRTAAIARARQLDLI